MAIKKLFDNNKAWSRQIVARDPDFFHKLARLHTPDYLWIGCSDARTPANEIVGLLPGELFVHRNVANLVIHTDLNCLSVLQFAVDILKIKHVIVCGHYGCGGVRAAIDSQEHGLIDNWVRKIKDIYRQHQQELDELTDREQQLDRLCELNVIEQVANVSHTNIVQDAWKRGQALAIHGWIFSIADGILHDLKATRTGVEQVQPIYRL